MRWSRDFSFFLSLTVDPGNADRLAEGEQQQGGAAADMMVQQLEQVYPSLMCMVITIIVNYSRNYQLEETA